MFIDLLLSHRKNSILCNTFLSLFVLLIHLVSSSLNKGWHIYKIVEPVILTDVVVLVLSKNALQIEYSLINTIAII